MTSVHFSSERPDWATPWPFFQEQDRQYGPFGLDVCALAHNAKCKTYFSPSDDGLKQPWAGICWMNPPYGREISKWISKAVEEVQSGHAKRVVCLLPARTDTAWWHDIVMPHAKSVDFIRGRLKFEGAKSSAPFPSVIVIFENSEQARGF